MVQELHDGNRRAYSGPRLASSGISMLDDQSELEAFQHRLSTHFSQLSTWKAAWGSTPVYALEHPLNSSELEQLKKLLVSDHRRKRELSESFWLCWVVFAAEAGYRFSGLAYWEMIEPSTFAWPPVKRLQIAKWSRRFSKLYHGAEPRGIWANRYKYISWPVTHALLPLDLQLQLAQALHYSQKLLIDASGMSDLELGIAVGANSFNRSARYEQFLQSEEYVGQIVHALLEDKDRANVAFYGPSIERITSDLGRHANAAEWLRTARERYLVRNIRLAGRSSSTTNIEDPSSVRKSPPQNQTVQSGILPTAALELRQAEAGHWDIWLLPPSFDSVSSSFPGLAAVLRASSFSIAGTTRSAPASDLLRLRPSAWRLKEWLAFDGLIKIEPAPAAAYINVIESARLPQSQAHVFALEGDGHATHRASGILNPNDAHIIVTTAREQGLAELGEPVPTSCDGVFAVLVPSTANLNDQQTSTLSRLGIRLRDTIRVKAAGLSPRGWHCGDTLDCLDTESLILSVETDGGTSCVEIAIDDEVPQIVQLQCGITSFVSLGRLPEGRHTVLLKSLSKTPQLPTSETKRELRITSRSATSWYGASPDSGAFSIHTTPQRPSIRDLASGNLVASVTGPSTKVQCDVTLLAADGTTSSVTPIINSRLPLDERTWSAALTKALDSDKGNMDFVSAREGFITFDGGDYGAKTVHLLHDVEPVRWAVKKCRGNDSVLLLNDGLDDYDVSVFHSSFASPLVRVPLSLSQATAEIDLNLKRGLFVATGAGFEQSIVACPRQPDRRSGTQRRVGSGLIEDIDATTANTLAPLEDLSAALKVWISASPSNALARIRQRAVARSLSSMIVDRTCGHNWTRLEAAFDPAEQPRSWLELESEVDRSGTNYFAKALKRKCVAHNRNTFELSSAFAESAWNYLQIDHKTAELCWRVSSDPANVPKSDWNLVSTTDSSTLGILCRGARFLSLASELLGTDS